MVQVAGKPVLQHNVEWLRSQGVYDLAVNLHHQPEAVRQFLASGSRFGVSVHYSEEPDLLGTAGAVAGVTDWLGGEDFLVLYADNIIVCDLPSVKRHHASLAATLTMALYWREDVTASGVATVDGEGRVTEFVEKPGPGQVDSHWISAGLLLCRPDVLDHIPAGRFSDFGRDILPQLLGSGEVIGGYQMRAPERLHWIDTAEDLAVARAALSATGPPR